MHMFNLCVKLTLFGEQFGRGLHLFVGHVHLASKRYKLLLQFRYQLFDKCRWR